LVPIASTLTTFLDQTGADASNGAGWWYLGGVDTGLPTGAATLQVRAWYNGGVYSTYEAAVAAGVNTGMSGVLTINLAANTSPVIPTPIDAGMTAFSVAAPVPEPTTLALAGLGGFGMLLALRRKKA
jgi:hypothetical protein